MPGQRPILAMSFVASLGLTLNILACSIPRGEASFWPLVVFLTYFLLPLPYIVTKQLGDDPMIGVNDASASRLRDYGLFLTAGIMVSSMALPIVMARTPVEKPMIAPIPCVLVEIGNLLCFSTIGLFCVYFKKAT